MLPAREPGRHTLSPRPSAEPGLASALIVPPSSTATSTARPCAGCHAGAGDRTVCNNVRPRLWSKASKHLIGLCLNLLAAL